MMEREIKFVYRKGSEPGMDCTPNCASVLHSPSDSRRRMVITSVGRNERMSFNYM